MLLIKLEPFKDSLTLINWPLEMLLMILFQESLVELSMPSFFLASLKEMKKLLLIEWRNSGLMPLMLNSTKTGSVVLLEDSSLKEVSTTLLQWKTSSRRNLQTLQSREILILESLMFSTDHTRTLAIKT